jgi:hypothetical protein
LIKDKSGQGVMTLCRSVVVLTDKHALAVICGLIIRIVPADFITSIILALLVKSAKHFFENPI